MCSKTRAIINILFTDKTGTITVGRPKVIDVIPAKNISQKELLQIIEIILSECRCSIIDDKGNYIINIEIRC